MEVVGPEGCVALGALALPGVVARLHALKAEDVEALGEHRVLLAHVAAWARQAGLQHTHTDTQSCEGPCRPAAALRDVST